MHWSGGSAAGIGPTAAGSDGLLRFGAAVTFAFDEDDLRVVKQAVEQSGSHGGVIGEDTGPLLEGGVAGDDGRTAFVAFADDLEEEFSAAFVEGKIAKFIQLC